MNFYDRLSNLEIIYFKDCFKLCNGHCCNANKTSNVIIPMLKSEYLYIKNKTNLNLVGEISYKLNEQKTLNICFLECSLKGLCKFRPLACKLYPFFAFTNDKGEYLGCKEISLNDLFYKNNKNHPCPLVQNRLNELKTQFKTNVKNILNEPIIIFIFQLLELVFKQLEKYFQNILGDFSLDDVEDKKEFFKSLKFQNAFKNDDFKTNLHNIYENLYAIYPKELDKYL